MAFNLKKVLKALLLSSSQPLAIKDIQAAFTRFHAQGDAGLEVEDEVAADAPPPVDAAPAEPTAIASESIPEAGSPVAVAAESADPAEIPLEPTLDPELYVDVPSLITATQIREAMDGIAADLRAADEGLLLIEGNSGYRLVTHPRFARWVRILRQEPPPAKLTQSAIETLAVISYRQPVTKTEIETIRRVASTSCSNANSSISSAGRTPPVARFNTARRTSFSNLSASSRSMNCQPRTCSPRARSTSGSPRQRIPTSPPIRIWGSPTSSSRLSPILRRTKISLKHHSPRPPT